MPSRHHRTRRRPLERLMMAFRAAAVGIEYPGLRKIAAREADAIPQTRIERAHGGKGKVAEQGRAIMRHLPTMPPEDLPQAARDLRACADALMSDFYVTSEVKLSARRRSA